MTTEPGDVGAPAGERRRRWPLVVGVVGVVVLGLVAVGAWGWYGWLPNHRPDLRHGESYGIDVSSHQGSIDWDRVAADRIEFAYVKATEGGDFVDARFGQGLGRP